MPLADLFILSLLFCIFWLLVICVILRAHTVECNALFLLAPHNKLECLTQHQAVNG